MQPNTNPAPGMSDKIGGDWRIVRRRTVKDFDTTSIGELLKHKAAIDPDPPATRIFVIVAGI